MRYENGQGSLLDTIESTAVLAFGGAVLGVSLILLVMVLPGDATFMTLAFPYSMLNVPLIDEMELELVLALLQFPVYGLLLGAAHSYVRRRRAMMLLTAIHLFGFLLCQLGP